MADMIPLMTGLGYSLWRLTLGNPILLSVISQSSRRTLQTWLRTGYVAILIVTALLFLVGAQTAAGVSMSKLGQAGERMFTGIALLQLLLICVLSPVFAGGAIIQLRDAKTFPVLLSTPLSTGQIILGTLFSRVFLIWALLAGGIPILAVTRMFGRVSNSQIFLATGVAAATALFTAAFAVGWSALVRGGRRSLFAFYAGIFAWLVLVPALQTLPMFQLPADYTGRVTWVTPLHPLCILTVLRAAPVGDPGDWEPPSAEQVRGWGAGTPWDWYLSDPAEAYMTLSALAGLLLIIPAIVRLRSESALNEGASAGGAKWLLSAGAAVRFPGVLLQRYTLGLVSKAAAADLDQRLADLKTEFAGTPVRRARTVWHNPIAWREAGTRAGSGGRGAAKWLFVAAGVGVAVILAGVRLTAGTNPVAIDNMRTLVAAAVTVEFLMVLAVVLNTGSAAIARERESETLDLLLSTPITPAYYVWGKLRGLVSFTLPMIAVPGLTVLAVFAADLLSAAGTGRFIATVIPEAAVSLPLVMTVFCALGAVTGLRVSLSSRKTTGAVVRSVVIAVVVLAVLFGIGGIIHKAAGGSPPGAISSLSPLDAVLNVADPWSRFPDVMTRPELAAAGAPAPSPGPFGSGPAGPAGTGGTIGTEYSLRLLLFLMSVLSALVYGAAVYVGYRSILLNFLAVIRRQQA